MIKAIKTILLIAPIFLLISCNEENNKPKEPIDVTGVSLSADKTELYLDETANLTVTVSPNDADNKSYTFNVVPSTVGKVEKDVFIPLIAGECEVIATTVDGNFQDKVSLKILERNTDEMVSDKKLIEELSSSVYSSPINSENNWGLSDIPNVGVDEEKLNNEELYPVPTEGDIKTYIAEDYGVTFDAATNSNNMCILLENLKTVSGIKIIKFKSGTYKFAGTIIGNSVEDVYFVGEEGTKFVYSGWLTYAQFTLCKNIHFNNIIFDMNPSPTITGDVVSSSEDATSGTVTIKVTDEFDLTNSLYGSWNAAKPGSYAEYKYDEENDTYVPDINKNLFYNPGIIGFNINSLSREITIKLSKSFGASAFTKPAVGTRAAFAFRVYENFGFYFKNCENSYMDNVTCYVASGMGLRTDNGKNLYLNRVKFMRDPESDRLITCCADILHTCNLEGDAKFTNCILEGSHDDAINVKSFYTEITKIIGNVVTVKQTQSEVNITFDEGDEVDIYDPSTMQFKDRYTVQSVAVFGGTSELTLDRSVPSKGTNSCLNFNLGNGTKAVHLDLENSIIKNKRNRGILLLGRNSKIKNCTFLNVVMGAIQVLSVGDVFKEAIVPENIEITNNKIISCVDSLSIFTYGSSGKSVPGTLKDVRVSNNFIYNNTNTTMYLRGVGEAQINNNLFYENNSASFSIRSVDTIDSTIKDNVGYKEVTGSYKFFTKDSNSTNITEENNTTKDGQLS